MNRKIRDAIDGFILIIIFWLIVLCNIIKYVSPTRNYYAPDERPGLVEMP